MKLGLQTRQAPQPSLSLKNTIGCTDEGLYILGGRQQEMSVHVDWEDQSWN